jgi:hypothetical protein
MTKKGQLHSSKFPLICILEENKLCDNCCDCFVCDLDPNKICDNCAKCLELPDYNTIIIDDILIMEESDNRDKNKNKKSTSNGDNGENG